MIKRMRPADAWSDGHAHELLVGLDDLVAGLDHQLEGDARFLHGDHALMELIVVAEENLARDFGGLALFGVHGGDHFVEDGTEISRRGGR